MASDEIVYEAARVMTDSLRGQAWADLSPLHFAQALADAGLLRPEMTEETDLDFGMRRHVTGWEEVEDGE